MGGDAVDADGLERGGCVAGTKRNNPRCPRRPPSLVMLWLGLGLVTQGKKLSLALEEQPSELT